MKDLIIYSAVNKPGKKDATGAFKLGALALLDHLKNFNGVDVIPLNCRKPIAERKHALELLAKSCKTAYVFCHGTRRSLQIGLSPEELAQVFPAQVYVLYACHAGGGPGDGARSYAARLADAATPETGFTKVYAHTTKGHSFKNPYVRLFEGGSADTGGSYLVSPGSPVWKTWRKTLATTDLWMDLAAPGLDLRWSCWR